MTRVVLLTSLLAGCAGNEAATYNTTGPSGALVSQQVGFDANICRYDTGLTLYTQGTCPAEARTNVYTR